MDSPPITRPEAGEAISKLWRHVNRLADAVEAQRGTLGVLDARTPRRRPMDVSGGGSSVRLAIIVGTPVVTDDYVTCHLLSWDGATLTEGETATLVALPPTLRNAVKPTSDAPGFTFEHEPPYAEDTVLIIARVSQGTGVTVDDATLTWVDVTPGRAWAVKLPLCIDGTTYYQKTHGGNITEE